jgi:hypothetical protein
MEGGELLAKSEVRQGEVGSAAEGGPQRTNDDQEQVNHHAMMHDGGPATPGTPAIVATVGKLGLRTTSWRGTTIRT